MTASGRGAESHSIDLGFGFRLSWTFVSSSINAKEVEVELTWEDAHVASLSVSLNGPPAELPIDAGLARGQIDVEAAPTTGDLSVSIELAIRDDAEPGGWRSVIDIDGHHLGLFDPTEGEVAGSATAYPLQVDPAWGPNGASGGSSPTRFHLDDQARWITDVGARVKRLLFPDHPPLVLNIVACCGKPTDAPDGPGVYGDPTSNWFNVFFGTYQMDCAKADGWTRPFGYESADGVDSVTHPDDIVRIGTGDWNWFSNYMYGVPEEFCLEHSTLDPGAVTFEPTETITVGSSRWHRVTMSGVTVVSPYQSAAQGAAQLTTNSILTPDWQESFGLPCPRNGYDESFIPTTLMSTMLMTYWEDDDAFHTLIFGGTAGVHTDPAFVAAQVDAAEAAITAHYPTRGFAP